ncbi:MAG TPA: hypothetical protein VMT52_06240 [Planctomycetota bacterium]|nr:hypothetical protein [Planctomycetota bacterium]
MSSTDLAFKESAPIDLPVKTVYYRKRGVDGASGRVSLRTFREMISRWEIGPDDTIRVDGEASERRVREYPALSPLDEMLQDASGKVLALRHGQGRRADVIRELEMLREYAELNDRVHAVASFLLGWLRYAENPSLSRGLFLKAIERGYPVTSVARNNLAVAQIRLGDPAGRDNLILAANDPRRVPAALWNLARLLQHLHGLGESTDEIANVKDLLRVARAEHQKTPVAPGDPASFAFFLCEGDIPASFASEARTLARAQGQIEDILAEAEDCLRQGRLEQALAQAARAAAEVERARDDLSRVVEGSRGATAMQGQPGSVSPLRFLSVRVARIEKAAGEAKNARSRQENLDTFRRRLLGVEESLKLKVPPADIVQQAEVLLDAARSPAEREEAQVLVRDCQRSVARHLLETASELLSTGERDVAVGLLRRAQVLDTDLGDEIKLRLASLRREELEKEILRFIEAGAFEEARVRIARLRSIHPIFEPVAMRLEAQADSCEAGLFLDRVVAICGVKAPDAAAVEEARRLLEAARSLQADAGSLSPIEEHVAALARKLGLPPIAPPVRVPADRPRGGRASAARPPPNPEEPQRFMLEDEKPGTSPGGGPTSQAPR